MSRLSVDLIAPPFHGHLHPLLGLVESLREVADVRLLTTPDAIATMGDASLSTHPLLSADPAAVWRIANTARAVRSRPWMMWQQLQANLQLLPSLHADVTAAWRQRRPDLAIVDFTLPSVGHLAQRQGIRWWTAHPSPLAIETPDGTPSYLGGWHPPRGGLGRLRDRLGRNAVRGFKRTVFAASRAAMRRAGLPAVYRPDGTEAAYSDEVILAFGVRELEFTQTLPRAVRFIGPVLATPIRDPGSRVQLDRIRPNILVTIGTHLNYARAALRRNIRQWAAACPEFHFHYSAGGNDGLAELESGPNWRGYAYINYEQELPAFAAVVHHAGAGITYHCLSAGLPAVVLPHDYDQFDFAARLEHHGLARRSRRPAGVVPLLREITTDAALRSRLERFRAIVRRHNPGEEVQRLLQETALGPALGQPS